MPESTENDMEVELAIESPPVSSKFQGEQMAQTLHKQTQAKPVARPSTTPVLPEGVRTAMKQQRLVSPVSEHRSLTAFLLLMLSVEAI